MFNITAIESVQDFNDAINGGKSVAIHFAAKDSESEHSQYLLSMLTHLSNQFNDQVAIVGFYIVGYDCSEQPNIVEAAGARHDGKVDVLVWTYLKRKGLAKDTLTAKCGTFDKSIVLPSDAHVEIVQPLSRLLLVLEYARAVLLRIYQKRELRRNA
ncbi:hypothetical protein BDV98DRAFT_581368 [Pterulicium gracile]|uniref:Uncharacterized protein n=1 Tax=Pterulicium gracile TaxID=1884261 RepID=A0A5C3QT20_9AGAR|nr:hypothetical protein BDV98DRAFT_581368 [Pterula gracilis]